MKNAEPNCARAHRVAPGPHAFSMISLVHSNACMPTNVAPSAAVAHISSTVRSAVAPVAEVHRHRHRAAAGDQHEGHDRDQDQRDVAAAEQVQREHLARVRPRRPSSTCARSCSRRQEAREDEGVARAGRSTSSPCPRAPGTPACRRTSRRDALQAVGRQRRRRECVDAPLARLPAHSGQQHAEHDEPDEQQEMPVDRAQLDSSGAGRSARRRRRMRSAARPSTNRPPSRCRPCTRSAGRRTRSRDCPARSTATGRRSSRQASTCPARKAMRSSAGGDERAVRAAARRPRATRARGRAACAMLPATSISVLSHRMRGIVRWHQSDAVRACASQ